VSVVQRERQAPKDRQVNVQLDELAAAEVGQRPPVGVCGLADAADDQMPALNELRTL
jgi:hypothetical protein